MTNHKVLSICEFYFFFYSTKYFTEYILIFYHFSPQNLDYIVELYYAFVYENTNHFVHKLYLIVTEIFIKSLIYIDRFKMPKFTIIVLLLNSQLQVCRQNLIVDKLCFCQRGKGHWTIYHTGTQSFNM